MCLVAFLLMQAGACRADDEVVGLPPLPGGPEPVTLSAHLFRAAAAGRRPAVVFLHGCGGLLNRRGAIGPRERAWAERLNAAGISVLMVDSFNPRHHGPMCAPAQFDAAIYRARPFDAYAALRYLQARDDVRADRIGVIGWSEGGGALLGTVRADSPARPALLAGDFRMAIAFYPASCNARRQGAVWRSSIPLLVLVGSADVWTPAEPCRALVESRAPATDAAIRIYPGAFHDFDWPGMPVHEVPAFRTRAGVVPIEGEDPAAAADATERVAGFVAEHLQD